MEFEAEYKPGVGLKIMHGMCMIGGVSGSVMMQGGKRLMARYKSLKGRNALTAAAINGSPTSAAAMSAAINGNIKVCVMKLFNL